MLRSFLRRALAAGLLLVLSTGTTVALAAPAPGSAPAPTPPAGHHEHQGADGEVDVNLCGDDVGVGTMRCLARKRIDDKAKAARPHGRTTPDGPAATAAGSVGNNGGYDPSYLQSAYNVDPSGGAGRTVAIVDAYDNPNVESDLAFYRSTFGLPPCTTDNGCFRKVDQRGGTAYPAADGDWGAEIALDVDMVSAICPHCNILLVEADQPTIGSLGAAVNTAVSLGSVAVSNSYGGPEYNGESADSAAYYNHPGVAITVSSGDSGYGTLFPAASQYVTAVGGTSLYQTTNTGTRNATESAWSGSGSGCSGYEPKPSWQHDSGCTQRTVADVSAVADPQTGVWAYDTYPSGGWGVMGGTSVAAPIVAAMYALAGDGTTSSTAQLASAPYGDPSAIYDVTNGPTKNCGTYLCIAGPGYDGPTGLGTPTSTSLFTPPAGTASGGSTAPTGPTAPQNVTATAGNARVDLSWTAPASSTGSVTYDVYRSTGTNPPALIASGLTTTAFANTGLTNGVSYTYTVSAVSGGVEGDPSAPVQAVPVGLPGAPRNVSAKTASPSGVVLTWKPPSTNGGSPVTGYVVYRSTTSRAAVDYATVSCTASTSCTFTDTSTNAGTVYYFQVAAVTAAGTGTRSSQVQARAR